MTAIKLGVYDTAGNFYGYKADTFWSLSQTYAKEHTLGDQWRLVSTFAGLLNRRIKEQPSGPGTDDPQGIIALLGTIIKHNQDTHFAHAMEEQKLIVRCHNFKTGKVLATVHIKRNNEGQWEVIDPAAENECRMFSTGSSGSRGYNDYMYICSKCKHTMRVRREGPYCTPDLTGENCTGCGRRIISG